MERRIMRIAHYHHHTNYSEMRINMIIGLLASRISSPKTKKCSHPLEKYHSFDSKKKPPLMMRRIDISNLMPKTFTKAGREIKLNPGSPRVSQNIRATDDLVPSVFVRVPKYTDLSHGYAEEELEGKTELASKNLYDLEVFTKLLSHAAAVAVSGNNVRPVMAGTAYQLVLMGIEMRSETHRFDTIRNFLATKTSYGMTNLTPDALEAVARSINATVASLDADRATLDAPWALEADHSSLAGCFAAYIFEGLP
jgi:hypothetical protein